MASREKQDIGETLAVQANLVTLVNKDVLDPKVTKEILLAARGLLETGDLQETLGQQDFVGLKGILVQLGLLALQDQVGRKEIQVIRGSLVKQV